MLDPHLNVGVGRHTGYCDTSDAELSAMSGRINALKRDYRAAVVIASGNDNYADAVAAPACISGAVTVGNTTRTSATGADAVFGNLWTGYAWTGSNSSAVVDLLAPQRTSAPPCPATARPATGYVASMRRTSVALVAVIGCLGPSWPTSVVAPSVVAPSVVAPSVRVQSASVQRAPAVRAFPGAQGFGTSTPGGRGGRVIRVTNLNDHGPGSFRAAVRASGRRIVVFRASGTIRLETDIDIVDPYVTVAGQTAPGGGITLRADPCNDKGVLGVHTHDVVIRFLRLRPGPHPCAGPGESSDGIVVYKRGTHHVVVDHCSISWAVDENISLYDDAHDITFSWNIVSEGLSHSTHAEGEHSKGAHLSGERTGRISFHHNLLAHNNDRNPQPTNPGVADIRNNVVYDYGKNAALTSNSHGKTHFNFVGNYYKPGPSSDRSEYELDVYGSESVGWAFYVRGNIGPHRTMSGQPQRWTIDPAGRPWMVPEPFPSAGVRTTTARTAYAEVLAAAGDLVPYRDAVDRRIVRDVGERTGSLIDHPSEVGGWPDLPAAPPPPDGDRDGMPTGWELERGLDPEVDDSAGDRDGDGYTNIEDYLDWLVR